MTVAEIRRANVEQPVRRAPFRRDIQGLRAVAVVLVVAFHANLPMPGGYIGVDVFFVISGFLITNHLLSEVQETGRLNFGRFYARRVLRILPASFVVLISTLVAALVVMPPALMRTVMHDAAATALYVPNVLFAWTGTDYLAETAPSPYQHYWSLGVEEQFYLVWPLVLVIIWKLSKGSLRTAGRAVVALVAASFAVSLWLTFESQPWAFFLLPSRGWQLGVGALIAVAGPSVVGRFRPWLVVALGWLGLGVVLAAALLLDANAVFPGYMALAPVLGAAAVIFFGQQETRFGPVALLGLRPMQFLGVISYSLYLVHWPLLVLPTHQSGRLVELPLVETVALAVFGVPLAWLLYRLVECPLRSARSLKDRRPRVSLLLAAAVSVVTASVALGSIVAVEARPMSSEQVAKPVQSLAQNPVFTSFVPQNMVPSIRDAPADIPSTYRSGCHLSFEDVVLPDCVFGDTDSKTSIALFGDSHAAQWFPALDALAADHKLRLEVFTKSSCPAVAATVLVKGIPYTKCDRWRERVIARLAEDPPDVVMLSSLGVYPGQGSYAATPEEWAEGLATTLRDLPGQSAAIVIADTPSMTETPAICLSANLTTAAACSRPLSEAVHSNFAAAEAKAAAAESATVFDFTRNLCDRTTCGVIMGSTLVYRDTNHLTATFASMLAPVMWMQLEPILSTTD